MNPSLDTELLLAHVLKKDRSWLLAHPNTPLSPEEQRYFDELVARRKAHEPIAYIIGEKEFYRRTFSVDSRVLIPRPSTEALIDEVKAIINSNFNIDSPRMIEADSDIVIYSQLFQDRLTTHNSQLTAIIDVGTGSGCIAITLALEIPDVQIIATDISEDALDVAKENSMRHGVDDRIKFVVCSGLPGDVLRLRSFACSELAPLSMTQPETRKPANQQTYLAVSNPPYIPTTHSLPPDVSDYEPHDALFAGPDGMDVLTQIHNQCLNDPNCVAEVLECRLEQAKKLQNTL